MKLDSLDPNHAVFKVPISLWSFGERIVVALTVMNDGLLVDISSECLWPTQIEDWGKNRKNVQKIFSAIARKLDGNEGVQVPFCRDCGYLLALAAMENCPECGGRMRVSEAPSGNERTRILLFLRIAIILSLIEVLLISFGAWLGLTRSFILSVGISGAAGLLVINVSTMVLMGLIGSMIRRRGGS